MLFIGLNMIFPFYLKFQPLAKKFQQADQMGPTGQKGNFSGHGGDEFYPIKLWFDFREKY